MAAVSCYLGLGGQNGGSAGTSVYFAIGGPSGNPNNGVKRGGNIPGSDGVTSAYFDVGPNAPPTSVYFTVNSAPFGNQMIANSAYSQNTIAERQQLPDYFKDHVVQVRNASGNQMSGNSAYSQSLNTVAERQQLPDYFKDHVVQVRSPCNNNNFCPVQQQQQPRPLSRTSSNTNTIMERQQLPDVFQHHVQVPNPTGGRMNGNSIYSESVNTVAERQKLPDYFKDHVVQVRSPNTNYPLQQQLRPVSRTSSNTNTIMQRQQLPDVFKHHVVQVRNPSGGRMNGNSVYSQSLNTVAERQQLPDYFKDHVVQVRNPKK